MKKNWSLCGLLASMLVASGIGPADATAATAASTLSVPAQVAQSISSPSATNSSTSDATRYPVILVNGLFGTDKYLGVYPYWFGIVEDLEQHGAKVYVASVRTIGSEAERGQDLLDFINKVAPGQKVNLIGHSQGGFTVRYVAQIAPDRVASVTTIGTPHWGAPLADAINGVLGAADKVGIGGLTFGAAIRAVLNPLADILGVVIQGNANQNAEGALGVLDSVGAAAFNKSYSVAGLGDPTACTSGATSQTIEGNAQLLYSWGGSAFRAGAFNIPYDASLKGLLDPALLDPTTAGLALAGDPTVAFGFGNNDGLVPVCRSKFGQVIGTDFKWNHLDEVNQILGVMGGNAEDPVAVIRTHVARLKSAGL